MVHSNKQAMPTGRQAFTLIELLVSISIIATLTAVLLPNFMGAREKAKDSQKIQGMAALKNALRSYYNDFQRYPVGDGITNIEATLETAGYTTSTGIGFTYYQTNGGDGFQLCSYLESAQGTADTESQTKCGAPRVEVCGNEAESDLEEGLYVICAN